MPFAVHLTSANLAAMDVSTNIAHTQIIPADAIELTQGKHYGTSLQMGLFSPARRARTAMGEEFEVVLHPVDAVLGNPPFTKIERGISQYVNMGRFSDLVGGEVGLWGHFVPLASEFLADGGTYGAVIPINILRGRESTRVRQIIFSQWTPLYVLKPVVNYGFSEWSEYRDIIIVARKQAPPRGHKVKFCLVKKDLTTISESEISQVANRIESEERLRSQLLDIDSHPLSKVTDRQQNLMWFCGCASFDARDAAVDFISKAQAMLGRFTPANRREGIRSEGGGAKVLFFTRSVSSRAEQAFLRFEQETLDNVTALTRFDTAYEIERTALVPSLRTPVGLTRFDIAGEWDYVAQQPYAEFARVAQAAGFNGNLDVDFWSGHRRVLEAIRSHLLLSCRINPYSPNSHCIAFMSESFVSPGDQLASIRTNSVEHARALCVLFNSLVFIVQFFLLSKEESTGRFLHIRTTDLTHLSLEPSATQIRHLGKVYDDFRRVEFPSLRQQFDANFDARFADFEEQRRNPNQARLWATTGATIQPAPERVRFDLAVLEAVGVQSSEQEIRRIYAFLVDEMIITRGLIRD